MNQGQPLQYPLDRLTSQPVQIDPNAPPFVPNYQAEDYLRQFQPYIAGLLMCEIQGGALRQPPAPLRIYAFNQFAFNGWQNEDFVGLFGKACDYIAFTMAQREFRSPDEAAIQLVPRLVSMIVADNTNYYPELVRYLTQEAWQAVQQQVGLWQRVKYSLDQFRARYPVYGYGQVQQRPYPSPQQQAMGGDPRMMYRAAMSGQLLAAAGQTVATLSGTSGSYVDPRLAAASQSAPLSSGVDNPYARMMAREKEQEIPQQSAVDVLKPPFSPRTPAPKEEYAMQPVYEAAPNATLLDDGSQLIPEELSNHYWLPTDSQPYRPSYQPSTQIRYHRVMPDGTVFLEVHEKVNMDYEQHNLPNSIFGKPREGVDYEVARANQLFKRGAEELSERMKWSIQATNLGDSEEGRTAKEKAEALQVSVITEKDWLIDISEVGVMLTTGVSRAAKAAEEGQSPDIFRRFAYLCEPVICEADQSDLIRRLSDSRTWLELAGKIEAAVQEDDVGFVEAVSRRAIVTLNRVLALSLSIPPETLELGTDFDVATIRELEDALQERHPSAFNAYKNQQRNHIASMFQKVADPEVEKELRTTFVDPSKFPEGKAPWLGLLTSCITFSTLDMFIHDLDLVIDEGTGSLITEEANQNFHDAIIHLFNELPKDVTFAKHIFQTNDGHLLEVTKGDIGQEAYIVSRVHSVWIG